MDSRVPTRQVFHAHVDVDHELIARKLPTVLGLGHEVESAGVDDRHLRLGIRAAVGCARAPAVFPCVASEAVVNVEPALINDLAEINVRPTHDLEKCAAVCR